ncbi:hypothetical protein [Actinomyces bowdenii]|uniref:Uncharacterized protein n=1 Tax=Actinomyces bowdenii TaxID=131109 RepID=A0A853EGD4_9ACTO|nr:hypothetical protein [Actinomyces bowdenii]MBF0696294.1 hypothetical protein [Actinomyces bowdenii]NYS68467.1 hypothetical protein [Actinomyces bowdenii]
MSSGPAGPPSGADDEDIPAWLAEVVVMAEHVRSILRRQAPLMGAGMAAMAALGWAGVPALPWLAAACALGAGYIALRHALPPLGAGLRPGAWTGLVLLVLDLALTPWVLALALGLRLGGAPQPLLHAAACAAAGALVSTGALLAGIVLGARRPPAGGFAHGQVAIDDAATEPQPDLGRGVLTPVSVGLTLVMTVAVVWLLGGWLSWWRVGATALTAELGTLVVLRAGAWAQARGAAGAGDTAGRRGPADVAGRADGQ